jgi:hypothetical protein
MTKSKVPRHNWNDAQERIFTEWLNKELGADNTNTHMGGLLGKYSTLREYEQEKTRLAAIASMEMVLLRPEYRNMVLDLDAAVSKNAFTIKEGLDLHQNLAVPRKLLAYLDCFESAWMLAVLRALVSDIDDDFARFEAVVPGKVTEAALKVSYHVCL